MYTLLLFVIALSAIALALADQTIQADKPTILFPDGDALQFVDKFIQRASGKDTSVLGKEFRDEEGNLRKFKVTVEHEHSDALTDVGAAPVVPNTCPTISGTSPYYGAGTFNAAGGAVQWSYAVPYSYDYSFTKGSASASSNLCLVINGNLGAVNINTADGTTATKSSIPIGNAPVSDFVTCDNCYAYVGAQVSIGFVCTLMYNVSITSSATFHDACTIKFATSGATKFNMDFNIDAPNFNTAAPTQPSVLVPPPSTPIALMNDPSSGIYITASPALNYAFYGQMTGTGSLDITAGFSTTTGFTVGASIDQPAGQAAVTASATLAAFQGVTLNAPAIKSNMKFTNPMALNLNIIPTVTWTIGIGCGSGLPNFVSPECVTTAGKTVGVGMNMVVVTPFTAAYSWTQTNGATASAPSVATSGLKLSALASLTGVNAYLEAGFPYSTTVSTTCPGTAGTSLSSTDILNGCAYFNLLGDPIPTNNYVVFTGTAAAQSLEVDSAGGGGGDSNDDGSGDKSSTTGELSGGGIAGVVIGVLIAVGLIGFLVFKFVLPKEPMASSDVDEKKPKQGNPMQSSP